MSGMKDVPSTERMVMCSQRWKLLKQGEKDAYQKRCEQVRELAEYTKNLSAQNVPIAWKYHCNYPLHSSIKTFLLFYFRKRKNMKLRWTDFCV